MKTEQMLYAGTLAVLIIASGIAVGLQPGSVGPSSPEGATDEYATTAEGVRYTIDPDRLRQGCPGGMDCIPSIDDPQFQPTERATWLAADDMVIGVEIDDEARAYPLRILNIHEVVNDRLAGRPIAVTYCPLCRSGLVFSRSVSGETLTFGVSGKLLEANLVLYDRQTETYWSQIKGEVIVGPLVPTTLTLRPSTITTWTDWRRGHPDTQVLSRDTGVYPKATYDSNPYADYANSSGVGFGVGPVDDRLPAKTLVYGVTVGSESVAYPEETVRTADVINDEVGGVTVLVVEDPRDNGWTRSSAVQTTTRWRSTRLTRALSMARAIDGPTRARRSKDPMRVSSSTGSGPMGSSGSPGAGSTRKPGSTSRLTPDRRQPAETAANDQRLNATVPIRPVSGIDPDRAWRSVRHADRLQ